ncbi:MAG TPA: hypothetical protein VGI16_06535 [Candidatus Acidoferrum sp.]|jgi:hypothetical protein
MPFHGFGWLASAVPVFVQLVLFLRWLHRRVRSDEISRAFVRDLALNHLPHIYSTLQTIATRQGITLEEIPIVRFSDLNGHRWM